MPTNFDLAPPVTTVDGVQAVPIDIQGIRASLTFDGDTGSGRGDATLQFVMGPRNGYPVFDLRQPITGAWLDRIPVPEARLAEFVAHHDFGGGRNAEMRILRSAMLGAGTSHMLRLTYDLEPTPAREDDDGSSEPAMTWAEGPSLAFSFGFTDLQPGRYLEAWVPANLIFDQFEMHLELEVTNTAIPHSIITNGTVTTFEERPNYWAVAFPARFTSFSPLLEIRASNTVENQIDTVESPNLGLVTIEAWKLASSSVDLAACMVELKELLRDNASRIGPYLHNGRFVALFVGGGMEYDGGTTTSVGDLAHETYHSWWGRGIKPASQNDAWWDEAWTSYATYGLAPLAFDASEVAVALCSPSRPWIRRTPFPGAYIAGSRFFQGVASIMREDALRTAMAAFYQTRNQRPAATLDLESHLLCESGREELVDAFHRWVYGFGDSAIAPDLWMRDDPGHTGAESWSGTFWDSPDLWVRNENDNGQTHQDPVSGQDNWFYARVRNRGRSMVRHFMVTFAVKEFLGTEFVYPGDFLPCIAATGGFEFDPAEGSRIVKAKWPAASVPPEGSHGCLLASVHARANHPAGDKHVWEENALAQKNLVIVPPHRPGPWPIIPVTIGNWKLRTKSVQLELRRPKGLPNLPVSILYPKRHGMIRIAKDRLDCGGARVPRDRKNTAKRVNAQKMVEARFDGAKEQRLARGNVVRWKMQSEYGFPVRIGLRVEFPDHKKSSKGQPLLHVVQLDDLGRAVGGVAVMLGAGK